MSENQTMLGGAEMAAIGEALRLLGKADEVLRGENMMLPCAIPILDDLGCDRYGWADADTGEYLYRPDFAARGSRT